MKETIYTIPVNEAFEETCGCPICRMYDTLEANEIDRITGASMMEPSVRIETNKQGFCTRHIHMMFEMGRALPTALILESYLEGLSKKLSEKPVLGGDAKRAENMAKEIEARSHTCYVCGRADEFFGHELDTLFMLYKDGGDFKKKFEAQQIFCLPHAQLLLTLGKQKLPKKVYPEFAKAITQITANGFAELKEDVSWFCKKFDYRYADADWKNSKDSVQRSIKALTSKSVK